MLNFLNPILLWALLAVVIPVMIHLFSRQRVKKIDFSSLIFLKTLERTRLRALKIKEFLLLLIRSLIILFVVFAFARPSSKSGFASKLGAQAKNSILFLIDNSYRMGYETREGNLLWIAQKKCEELLKIYTKGDELHLITYNEDPEKFLSYPIYDTSLISRGIREIELSLEPADLNKSLESGVEIIRGSKNENKEIYLFTDLKTKELPILNKWGPFFEKEGIRLFLIGLSNEEKENWGIRDVESPSGVVAISTPFEIKSIVKNYSEKSVQNLLISLYLDGRRVSQTDANLKEGEETKISFTQSVKETGFHSGYLELSDDNLLADNKRFLTFKLPEKIEVLLVESKGKKENYLRLALIPVKEKIDRFKITQIDPKSFPAKNLSNYQVIIFSDLSELRPEHLPRLDDFLNSGKGIFFFFEKSKVELFEQISKRYINSIYKGIKDLSGSKEGFLTMEKLNLFHPIFQPYKGLDKSKFPRIRFFSIHEVIPGEGTKVLASFSNGVPALVESFSKTGKVLVFLSSTAPEFSDLGEHTILVPLLQRSIEYLSSNLFTTGEYLVGEKIRKEYELTNAGKVELLNPENQKVLLSPNYIEDRLVLKFEDLKRPGIYLLQSQDMVLDQFAVNLNTRDSDLGSPEEGELEKELRKNKNIIIIKPNQEVTGKILSTRYGKELSKNFLWLALVLLILEMLISKHRKKDLKYISIPDSPGKKGAEKI
ncbi:MAG: BatA domain-containing protein [candidate division Zixibacteria bacterium]|nr:BatA domain-containing protein [candidate division Zixibacteria bacterium]